MIVNDPQDGDVVVKEGVPTRQFFAFLEELKRTSNSAVTSVFGRSGDVTAIQADYDSFFLTPAEGNAAYLAIGATAADSELLDGIDSLNYARTDIAEIFTNNVTVQGTLFSGIDDNTAGLIQAFGDAAASTVGGRIELFTAADHDTTVNKYIIDAESDKLRLYGFASGVFAIEVDGGVGDVTLGRDLTVVGTNFFTGTDDVDLLGISGSIIIGGDGTSAHIAIDNNEIQAKATATTASNISINTEGGIVTMGLGGVNVIGPFNSLGIDDNATGERLQLADAKIVLGTAGSVYEINHVAADQYLAFAGGQDSTVGSNLFMYGESHATLASDMVFRAGTNPWMMWDESVGDLEILTGIGSKTSALTIDVNQDATFTGDINLDTKILFTAAATVRINYTSGQSLQISEEGSGVATLELDASQNSTFAGIGIFPAATTSIPSMRLPHGAAPSSPTDGDMWTTSAGGLFVRINGSTIGPLS